MHLDDARNLTRNLMDSHGLSSWDFRFNRRKRSLGRCLHPAQNFPGRIELSAYYVALNPVDEIRDTILHEIAHALAGSEAGHGPEWQKICVRIGCSPERTGNAKMPLGRWSATCPDCGHTYTRHRRPSTKLVYYCTLCSIRPLLYWRDSIFEPNMS